MSGLGSRPVTGATGHVWLVLVLSVGVIAGCSSDEDASTASSIADTTSVSDTAQATTSAPTTIPPASSLPLAEASPPVGGVDAVRVRIPRSPDWLASDDNFVYVKLDGGAVVRVDPVTAEPLGQVELSGDLCQGLGAGYGSVWSCQGTDVVRIDPLTDTVTATISVNKASAQGHLATGFDGVWVLVGDGSELVVIDPAANEAGVPIPLGVRGTDVAVSSDYVWVMSAYDGAVVRVDPVAMKADGTMSIAEPNCILASDALWVGTASSVVRIDEESLAAAQEIGTAAGRNCGLAASGTNLFLRRPTPLLVHVDTDEGTEVQRLTEDVRSSGDVLIAFDALWTTAYDDAALFRIPLE